MAGEIIRPKDLPPKSDINPNARIAADDGTRVFGPTIADAVGQARPFATQPQAAAGTSTTATMNPLTTKQSIASEVGVSLASKAQGDLAASAVQPDDLATVATSGAYGDLSGLPALGTAAATDASSYASAAQGGKADTALQSVVAGANVIVDATDPRNPIVSASAGGGQFPATRSALKALNTTAFKEAYLTEPGREGQFIWRAGDYSAEVAVDTAEGRVIKAANVAATIGAWHRPRERAYLFTDFGMDPTGATDSAPAFQAMLNYIKREGGGAAYDRPGGGNYRFDSLVSITDLDLLVAGCARELTEFHCNNSIGVFRFEDTGATVDSTYGRARRLQMDGITFVALNAGARNKGIAVEGVWPSPSSVGATQCAAFNDLNWRSQNYNSDDTNSGFWGKCLRVLNAHALDIMNPVILQINNTLGFGIDLEYDNDAAAYSIAAKGIRIQGGNTGIRLAGHVENIHLDIDEVVGMRNGIVADSTGSTIPGGRNPVISIRNGHINAKRTPIKVAGYNVVNISNCDIYKGVGFGDEVANLLEMFSVKYANIINSKMEVVAGSGAGYSVGSFVGVEKMRMGGCLVEGGHSGLVFSGGGSEITVDCDIRSNQSVAAGTGLFIDSGVPNGAFRGEVVGWSRGIDNNSSWDVSGARFRNNTVN